MLWAISQRADQSAPALPRSLESRAWVERSRTRLSVWPCSAEKSKTRICRRHRIVPMRSSLASAPKAATCVWSVATNVPRHGGPACGRMPQRFRYFPNRRHSRRLGWGAPVSGLAISSISALAGRVSGAGLCWRFSNFRFDGAETGSIADRERFAGRPSGSGVRPARVHGIGRLFGRHAMRILSRMVMLQAIAPPR
jgi:hypothetical protein